MASKKKQSSAVKKAVDTAAKKLESVGKNAEKLSKKQLAKAKEASKKDGQVKRSVAAKLLADADPADSAD